MEIKRSLIGSMILIFGAFPSLLWAGDVGEASLADAYAAMRQKTVLQARKAQQMAGTESRGRVFAEFVEGYRLVSFGRNEDGGFSATLANGMKITRWQGPLGRLGSGEIHITRNDFPWLSAPIPNTVQAAQDCRVQGFIDRDRVRVEWTSSRFRLSINDTSTHGSALVITIDLKSNIIRHTERAMDGATRLVEQDLDGGKHVPTER